ncbi:MAG: hypothetical protein E8D46_14305 [Nitrospira sp.]|nr:MAG: hypothetical protein E8D46_14305 [Nitrospira sp.]
MRLIFTKASCLRTMILVWAMTWTIMVPLFHVHPEADHHHGDASHVHGGTVHTVFSPDLECEYTETVHDSTCPEAAHQHLQARVHPGHPVNHPEIEFSLLTVPVDRPLPKPGITVAELPVVDRTTAQRAVVVASLHPGASQTILFLSTTLPLRAPPSQPI